MTDLPAALDHLDELAPLVDVPRLGLMVDFDGTLAPITPTRTRPSYRRPPSTRWSALPPR